MNLVKMEETSPPQHDRSEDGEHDERSNHCCKPCTYKRNSCAKEKGLQNLHAGDGFTYPLKLEETRTEVGFKTEEQDSTTILTELPLNSVAVEKVSINPEQDFRESMYEMMVEKGDVEEDMEELLNCYLMLNPAELHQTIRETFSRVWIDIIMTIR
ncbi:hypothetical protein KP509_13G055200 [Ceratopteris richardii]|nr:hypothetical protein KP509_13G055200 [Ceratopteris richardii]